MSLSIIIYFHTFRLPNLWQTIRFLQKRENVSDMQLVLVCQDELQECPELNFGHVKIINLRIPTYHKPLMCNVGVEAADGQCVVILDSDRVLPAGYFGRYMPQVDQIITTYRLYALRESYTDEQIEAMSVEYDEDFKSRSTYINHRKNAFSGNTLIRKEDYLRLGGMDVAFRGYGFADTDMTRRAIIAGMKIVCNEEMELHLWHEKEFIRDGQKCGLDELVKTCYLNEKIYMNKYRVKFV